MSQASSMSWWNLCTVRWGKGGGNPVAQMGGGVGPNQLITNCLHYSQTLTLPGTFKHNEIDVCTLQQVLWTTELHHFVFMCFTQCEDLKEKVNLQAWCNFYAFL